MSLYSLHGALHPGVVIDLVFRRVFYLLRTVPGSIPVHRSGNNWSIPVRVAHLDTKSGSEPAGTGKTAH